jgi:hypothetical protein
MERLRKTSSPNWNHVEWKDSEWKNSERLLASTGITQIGKTQNGITQIGKTQNGITQKDFKPQLESGRM